MHKVWLLLLPGFLLVDVMDLRAVFKAANASCGARKRIAGYDVRMASAAGGSVLSSSGVALSTSAIPPELVGRPGTLFISGEPDPTSAGPTGLRRLREWLCDNRRHLRRCAVQGAEALLPRAPPVHAVHRRGRAAPRHGRRGSALFKACTKTRDWRVVEPGQGTELALSWIEEDRGTMFVNALASRPLRPCGRRYGMPRRRSWPIKPPVPDARIAALHHWISAHLHEKLGVARLAQQVHMSTRSFARFYERATGLSPGRGLQQIRLDCACRMLETSTRPLKTIAAQCGYGSAEVMRRAFVRDLQMTPRDYRRRHATRKDASAA